MILMISANVNLKKYNHIQKVKLKTSRNFDTGVVLSLSAKVVYKSDFYWDFEVFVRSWGIITFEQKTKAFLMGGNCFPNKL